MRLIQQFREGQFLALGQQTVARFKSLEEMAEWNMYLGLEKQ